MQKFIYNIWNTVMDHRINPLRHIPDLNTRHLVMQILAWMWCIVFSTYLGSIVAFGVSAVLHALLLAGVVITVGTFEVAKRRPQYFGILGRSNDGEHD
jgi:hypothetical protein